MEKKTDNTPVGIYFDRQRNRWRVRLYKQRDVVHLSYHPTYKLAVDAWTVAIEERKFYEPRDLTPLPPTLTGIITGFRLNK